MRLIQVHAVDRLIGLLDRLGRAGAAQTGPVRGGARASSGGSTSPSSRCTPSCPATTDNREAALAMLGVLEGLVPVDARMAQAIRELAG